MVIWKLENWFFDVVIVRLPATVHLFMRKPPNFFRLHSRLSQLRTELLKDYFSIV